jgi:amidase
VKVLTHTPTRPHVLALLLAAGIFGVDAPVQAATFDLATATVADINAAFSAGALTSEKLTQLYLARIANYDRAGPRINSVITLNPAALAQARSLDLERKAGKVRSPLHGIPMVVKDVFDVAGLPTTGGTAVLAKSIPTRDAAIIARYTEAGAIVLAKVNLSDWFSDTMPGTTTIIGQTLSPYNLSSYVGGSSGGTGAAVTAWFGALGLGSDTAGSVPHPSSHNALVGLTATQGLVSRRGQISTSLSQERPGFMTRSVYDAAAMLDAVVGYDAEDLATTASLGQLPTATYTSTLEINALKGARIGVLREMFSRGPEHEETLAGVEKALGELKAAGAILLDPARTGLEDIRAELAKANVVEFERHTTHNAYFAALPADAPVHSLADLVRLIGPQLKRETVAALDAKPLDRNPDYLAALAQRDKIRNAVVKLLDREKLDALVLPFKTFTIPTLGSDWSKTHSKNGLHAYTGLPTLLVPAGFTASDGMPFGILFLARAWDEPKLLSIGYSFEQATHHRRLPPVTPALDGEHFDY